ncbi:MAG: phenylalanine--tRNA ligase subunit alpha [Verrucomicrobia bacterium]|nr:phenylalanine--tRNA ligase subunit alpha [Verrucomicrobiota bacterium]
MNLAEIDALTAEGVAGAQQAATVDAVEAVRIQYLGRKGLLPQIMKGLKDFAPAERGAAGRSANAFKDSITAAIEARLLALRGAAGAVAGPAFDYTLPGSWRGLGSLHPVSLVITDAVRIFSRMGFAVAEGPDIENAYNNFEALNTPAHHPSLAETDTFWLGKGELLRTQTSPVQIRVMQSHPPPVRIITPGRCYRRDTTDATHSASFHQIEGLYVDRQVSLADLKGTLAAFMRAMMGPDVGVRFRPHFFPFTEPSVECDFSCHVCGGKGCRVCKQSGWIEIAGAGMVDPRVFGKVGYDAEAWTGFAFGMGVERIAMIKYGIPDIRMLYENDARFLAQFG